MPLVGTWIEIILPLSVAPSAVVVPLVGTWIEISWNALVKSMYSRAPRGHVD